ncbi:M56 family metallopeptidase [Aquimarina pacifica]|uniref:M56 family metallopeptidase n=1 Tax=Aquimarina pacifica TaxID=1296415 RepID=UPI000471F6A7|nr:M56 family metallopeptidase [Aquimarina pacifica]
MTPHYLFQVVVFQVFFLIVYDLFHKKDTFFNWNRVYVILAPFVSLIMPFIKIAPLKTETSQIYVSKLERIVTSSSENLINISVTNQEQSETNWWFIFYLIGLAICAFLFILKLYKLKILQNFSLKTSLNTRKIVLLPNSKQAFSFWNTIYLGDALNKEEKENILTHEIIHVDQKHSLDQLWFEILKIIFWWNPMIYAFQSRITVLHEYIADDKVINTTSKNIYIQQLLNATFQTQEITFVNQFFNQSLIKKRILMLQKTKSKTSAKLKYLTIIPVLAGMLVYTSCNESEVKKQKTEIENKNETQTDIVPKLSSKRQNKQEPKCPNQNASYDKNLDNFLKVTSGKNAEVILDIVSIENLKSVRAIHLDRNQTYYVRNIPSGKYKVQVAYGEEYNEKMVNGTCKAFFENEKFTEEGNDILDFYSVKTEKGFNVPSYNLLLDLRDEDVRDNS